MTKYSTKEAHMIPLSALAHIEPSRLAKAATALIERSYFVTVSRWSETAITGCVRRKEKGYTVTLTTTTAHCDCDDSRFRHSHCKHVAMLALTLVKASQEVQERCYLGDTVNHNGRTGKVIAVSGDVVSVAWNSGRNGPVILQELKLAA
jgi:hypothetical protein